MEGGVTSLRRLRDAIKTTLDAAFTGRDTQVYDKVVYAPNLPAILIQPATTTFPERMARRGQVVAEFDLIVLVSEGDPELAQDELDAYVDWDGDRSIWQAIADRHTLGLGDGTYAWVDRMDAYGARYDSAGVEHIGATLRMIVRTT